MKKTTKNYNRIYFIGVGGIGVSALARYYLAKGCKVFGSDLCASEITKALKAAGAKIIIGQHKKENVPQNVDLVIYSPAVPKNHPELLQAKSCKIKAISYPQALGELTKQYFTIAVSGTHGKSTTCAMLSLVLIKAGLNPTVIIGTKLREFGDSNFRMGGPPASAMHKGLRAGKPILNYLLPSTNYLLIEADEHFASFLNYRPQMIVLTNIDADHLDYYKNLKNIIKTFKKYIGYLPKNGTLILDEEDKSSKKALAGKQKFQTKKFSLKQAEAKKLRKILKIPGDHMVADALAVLEAARALGIPDKVSFAALASYRGAWRRFEILKEKPFVLVSDYGHNPVKMLATLKSAREKYKNREIWCAYQPHQYKRTEFLFKEFVRAFRKAPADNIIITDIFDVAGREEKIKKVSSEKLVKAINKSSIIYLPKEDIVNYLKPRVKSGQVLIIMGAGNIYHLCDSFK